MEIQFLLFCFRYITMIFVIILLFLCVNMVSKIKIINSINLIENNIKASPIYSISLLKSNECSENEELFPIGYFAGSVDGKFYKGKITRGKCKKLVSKCKSIPEIIEFNMYKWDGNSFCVKRNIEYNYEYYLRNSVEYDSECEIGFKKCGILDTNNRKLCVEENNDCPINKMIIDNNELSPNDYKYNTLELKNNKFLHYTNEAIDNQIIVNFTISAGIPCLDPNEINTEYPQYILDKNFKKYSCSHKNENGFNDNIYNYLDSIQKLQLYKENDIYDNIINLPNYPYFSLNENINLYSIHYFAMEKEYFDNNFILNEISKANDSNDKYNQKIKEAFTYTYFLYIIIFIQTILTSMKDSTCKKNTQFVLSFIILIFWFTILILYFSSYFYLNNYNLLNFGFDQKRNFIIKKNMNVIKKYRKNLLSIVIISLLYLILLIIVLFMIKIKNGLDNIITVYRRDFHLEIEGKN